MRAAPVSAVRRMARGRSAKPLAGRTKAWPPALAKRWLIALGTPTRQRRGRRAERRAARHLRRRGLTLVMRNFATRGGEIDLVMRDGITLVFVEVRLRGAGAWLDGVASVDGAKRRRLTRAAQAFLRAHPRYADDPARFDVVAMSRTHFGAQIEWVRDAFTATS